MASSKSTGSAPAGRRSPRLRRSRPPRQSGSAVAGPKSDPPAPSVEQLQQLGLLVPRLQAIYGTAVTAELALRQQAAEQDTEVADCLRVGVCDPIADQIRELEDLVAQFRKTATGSKQ